MSSYGTNAAVQILAFGASDSNQDTRSSGARDMATSIINSKLGFSADLVSPSNEITRCANLLAAGIILSGQITVDSQKMHPYYEEALKMLGEIDLNSITELNNDAFMVERA